MKLSNPLSTKNDIAELTAELEKDDMDTDKMNDLKKKIYIKSAARGLLLAGAIIGASVAIVKSCNQQDDETTSDDE